MAKNNNLQDFLIDLSSTIKSKIESSDLINPQNFSSEITNKTIKKPTATRNITSNGTYDVENYLSANVNISHVQRFSLTKLSTASANNYSLAPFSSVPNEIKNNLTAVIYDYNETTGKFENGRVLPDGSYRSGSSVTFTISGGKITNASYIIASTSLLAVDSISTPHAVLWVLLADISAKSTNTTTQTIAANTFFSTSVNLGDLKDIEYLPNTYQYTFVSSGSNRLYYVYIT